MKRFAPSLEFSFVALLLAWLVLCIVKTFAAYVVQYDPDDATVPNRVVRVYKEPTDKAIARDNVLVFSDPLKNVPAAKRWENFPGPDIPNTHAKVDGNTVVEMSQSEKQAIDNAIAAQKEAQLNAAARDAIDAWVMKAFALALKDQFPTLDLQQLKSDFVKHYKQLKKNN